jgi:sigma-B regulation protein RsbU (phosphoserine phosphatase)
MEALIYQDIRTQLTDRRQQLQKAITQYNRPPNLINLLREVDRALEKLNNNNYGLCEVCHDPVETDRLLADPLVRFCLDHLTAEEQHSLERDLALANHIQRSLLPKQQFESQYWDTYYHYEPAGMVSGDYCDLMQLPDDDGSFLFILGDVSGKGVAASLLMTQLRAIFHTLFALNTPLNQLLAQANHMFCESTLASQYATLICGKTNKTGNVEITIAGHPPVLLKRQNEISKLEASGLPLGLF